MGFKANFLFMSQCIFCRICECCCLRLLPLKSCGGGAKKLAKNCQKIAHDLVLGRKKKGRTNVHACLSSSCFMVKSVVSSAKSFPQLLPCSLTAGTASHSASTLSLTAASEIFVPSFFRFGVSPRWLLRKGLLRSRVLLTGTN